MWPSTAVDWSELTHVWSAIINPTHLQNLLYAADSERVTTLQLGPKLFRIVNKSLSDNGTSSEILSKIGVR